MVDEARRSSAADGTDELQRLTDLITSSELQLHIHLYCPNAAELYRKTFGLGLCGYMACYQLHRRAVYGSDRQPDMFNDTERNAFRTWIERGSFTHRAFAANFCDIVGNFRERTDVVDDRLEPEFQLQDEELLRNKSYTCCVAKVMQTGSKYATVRMSNVEPDNIGPCFSVTQTHTILRHNQFLMHSGADEDGHYHLIDQLPDPSAAFIRAIRTLAREFLAETTPLCTVNANPGGSALRREFPVQCTPDIISSPQARMVRVSTSSSSAASTTVRGSMVGQGQLRQRPKHGPAAAHKTGPGVTTVGVGELDGHSDEPQHQGASGTTGNDHDNTSSKSFGKATHGRPPQK